MRIFSLIAALSVLPIATHAMTFTFDTDAQGFVPGAVSGTYDGVLEHVATGGTPGGFLRMTDVQSGGSLLPVLAPISGDLSGYAGVFFDQRLLQSAARRGIGVELVGTNGDRFTYTSPLTTVNEWNQQFAGFADLSSWDGASTNTATLIDTLASVDEFNFLFETSPTVRPEADLDNVRLASVPLPASGLIFLAALVGLSRFRRT